MAVGSAGFAAAHSRCAAPNRLDRRLFRNRYQPVRIATLPVAATGAGTRPDGRARPHETGESIEIARDGQRLDFALDGQVGGAIGRT